MSLITTLYTLLNPLCAGGYHDAPVAQDTPVPYLAWQRVAGGVENNIEVPPPIDNTHLQITAWAATRLEADQLATAVGDALEAAVAAGTFACWPIVSAHDTFDLTTRLRGVIAEYSIWSP